MVSHLEESPLETETEASHITALGIGTSLVWLGVNVLSFSHFPLEKVLTNTGRNHHYHGNAEASRP